MRFRWFMTNLLLIALVLAWLVPFVSLARYGTHTVQEPSLAILITEIGLLVLILAFAIFNLIKGERR